MSGTQQLWPADRPERWSVSRLVPYARNARTHSDAQVAQIAASIREWGWTTPILVDEAGGLIAGHGRVMAARQLGITEVPVVVARGWSEAQKRAYILADNKLALNSSFGFPAVAHPRDPEALYLLPLNGDSAGRYVPDAKAAVWRTRDRGESWQALRDGLPQGNAFFGVLRQAMATDPLSPAGVYFGTSSGSLFASADEGESWTCIAQHLPAISSVETLVVEA